MTSTSVQALTKSAVPTRHHCSSYYVMDFKLFKFELSCIRSGVGSGLSPDPRFYAFVYDHACGVLNVYSVVTLRIQMTTYHAANTLGFLQ